MKKIILLIGVVTLGLVSCKNKYDLPNGMYADIETNKGTIVTELYFEKTPLTVSNFVSLAEGTNSQVDDMFKGKKYYDGLVFHRVIKDFMIQGGDPTATGTGGPGYQFQDEIVDELKHDSAGVLSMANAGPDTNGSQFFITHKETKHLDGKHTIFGKVTKGVDVLNAIVSNDTIKSVKIIRLGSSAKSFNAPKVFDDKLIEIKENKKIEEKKAAVVSAENAKIIAGYKSKAKKLDSGLSYYIYEKGTDNKPKEGDKIKFDYAGYFENGVFFDSNIESIARKNFKFVRSGNYTSFDFTIGKKTGLLPGFIEGLEQLNYDDKAYIFIPSDLAYGKRGAGKAIPPNTDLVFELRLSK